MARRKHRTDAERRAAQARYEQHLDREDERIRALIAEAERETPADDKRRRAAEAIRKYGGPAAGLIVVVLGQPAADAAFPTIRSLIP